MWYKENSVSKIFGWCSENYDAVYTGSTSNVGPAYDVGLSEVITIKGKNISDVNEIKPGVAFIKNSRKVAYNADKIKVLDINRKETGDDVILDFIKKREFTLTPEMCVNLTFNANPSGNGGGPWNRIYIKYNDIERIEPIGTPERYFSSPIYEEYEEWVIEPGRSSDYPDGGFEVEIRPRFNWEEEKKTPCFRVRLKDTCKEILGGRNYEGLI